MAVRYLMQPESKFLYRFFEILPGFLAWGTLVLMVVASWKAPAAAAIFIILFDTYFLLKAIYFSLHLRATFRLMRENLATDWMVKVKSLAPHEIVNDGESSPIASWEELQHLILLPMYKEPYEVVKESIESLAKSDYPKEKMMVVLATEARAGGVAQEVADRIESEYAPVFEKFLVTRHPADVPGELPGKGSNESYALREAIKILTGPMMLDPHKVIVSVFDVDTQSPSGYFARLTYLYLTARKRIQAVYQPIPFFTNNVYEAPALARVIAFSATFWQMMQQARPERLTTFSSQSTSLQTLIDIGFWDVDVVSEDSRIFWQCYFRYHGDFRVVPMAYPVSMDANVTPSFWGTMKNLYKQQRRWGWGAENIPYMMTNFLKDKIIPRKKKWYWRFQVLEGFWSWATNSLIVFALGWLPVAIGGRLFNDTLLSYNLPKITRLIVAISMIGVASSAIISILLLPPKPKWFKKWHYGLYAIQWALIPVTMIVFGAFPGLEAQTRLMLGGKFRLGFWVTPKVRLNK